MMAPDMMTKSLALLQCKVQGLNFGHAAHCSEAHGFTQSLQVNARMAP